jgi:hypothetical protein
MAKAVQDAQPVLGELKTRVLAIKVGLGELLDAG